MGVIHLRTFMNNNYPSSICKTVSIKEQAKKYTAETGRTPRIVLDGNNVMYKLYNTREDEWMMGGQLKECVDKIEQFIEAFMDIGIELIFFFDGSTPTEMREKWITRKSEKQQTVKSIYDYLKQMESRGYSRIRVQKISVQPPLIGGTARSMIKYASNEKVQLRIAENDGDLDIAAYAKQHDCFAVMTDDTDFVILGQGRFMSMIHLDTTNMTTRQYDGHKLAEHFNIKFTQLPLFATLLGADILPFTNLQEYFGRLLGQEYLIRSPVYAPEKLNQTTLLFKKVANFVRTTPVGFKLLEMLPHIAETQLQDASLADLLRQSIEYYTMTSDDVLEAPTSNPDSNWQHIVEMLQRKHINSEVPFQMLNIISGKQFELSSTLEDFCSLKNLPSAAQAYLTLRRKIYGILLHEKPAPDNTSVEEWCVYGVDELTTKREAVIPVPADISHPGLITLWTDFTSKNVEDQRWTLFIHSVSPDLDSQKMKKLPSCFVVPTCVLYYMQHVASDKRLLDEWEVAAFLLTALEVGIMDVTELQRLPNNPAPPSRAVSCATHFAVGILTVHTLLAACGYDLEKFMPWHFFDGKLFLKNYLMMRDGGRLFDIRRHLSGSQIDKFKQMQEICK